jgi:hypothetical protein
MTPARRALPAPTEAAEQRMVAAWLNARRLCWLHPPNEGRRSVVTGAHLRSLGLKKGAPDVLVFTPPPGKFGIVGVAIEMKRRNGTASGVRPEQRDWLDQLKELGWATCVAFGADDAIAFLESHYGRA